MFNDYVELCETQSLQPTVDGYHYYFGEVSQTYDADYLKSKHEEVDEAEKSKEQPKGSSKNKNVGNMNEDEEDLADVLEEVEGGHEEYVEVAEGEEAGEMDVVQGDVSELIGYVCANSDYRSNASAAMGMSTSARARYVSFSGTASASRNDEIVIIRISM